MNAMPHISPRDLTVQLALQGMSPGAIAERHGWRKNTVYQWVSQARRSGVPIPDYRGGARVSKPTHLEVPAEIDAPLRDLAALHDMRPDHYARMLLVRAVTAEMEGE